MFYGQIWMILYARFLSALRQDAAGEVRSKKNKQTKKKTEQTHIGPRTENEILSKCF